MHTRNSWLKKIKHLAGPNLLAVHISSQLLLLQAHAVWSWAFCSSQSIVGNDGRNSIREAALARNKKRQSKPDEEHAELDILVERYDVRIEAAVSHTVYSPQYA